MVVMSRVTVLALVLLSGSCAGGGVGIERPGLEHAGCLILSERRWKPYDLHVRPRDSILLVGPDTVQLQPVLGDAGDAWPISGIGDRRFDEGEVRRARDSLRPLVVYPNMSPGLSSPTAQWRLEGDEDLRVYWSTGAWEAPPGERFLRVGLVLSLNPKASPMNGWGYRRIEVTRGLPVGEWTDSVPLEGHRIECPANFPYPSHMGLPVGAGEPAI